jgi:hypothetical protein
VQHVPEPDRSEWVARMRERARLDAEELLPRPPFAVFGLAEPRLPSAYLADVGQVNGVWESISLAYGDWAEPAGPWVVVTTRTGPADAGDREVEAELLRAIDHDRNRIASQAGVDEDDLDVPPDYSRADLAVGSVNVGGVAGRQENVWAAWLVADGQIVILVVRGVDPASVRLDPVADLAPYLRARNERLGRLSEHHRRQPPPVLEPAEGVAAYRALAEAELASHARLVQALQAGREPRQRAGGGPARHALWQRAVREQARISGIGERQANEIVTLVINHLTRLHEQAPWFTADPRLREAAIDETLRHAVLGDDVPSQPAQQAWARYWAQRTTSTPGDDPGEDFRSRLQAGRPLIAAWLQAWAIWAARG